MTVRQAHSKPVNLAQFAGVVVPLVIIILGWGINVNVRIKALEIEIDNIKQKGEKMENTLSEINKNLASIALNINTLTIKWEENEKKNNRQLESYPVRL